jgi:L-threonylcarbamoyladenylate synthase
MTSIPSSPRGRGHHVDTVASDHEPTRGFFRSKYLDSGPCPGDTLSTIVDLTGAVPRLLRRGVIPVARLRTIVPVVDDDEDDEDS